MANPNAGGNRRKSRDEHERAGTFRKDRHSDLRNPNPPQGRPTHPPGELDDLGRGEWERMLVRLESSQSLAVVDDGAIYQYCRLYSETELVAESKDHTEAAIERLEENLGDFKGEDFVKLIQELTTLRKLVAKCTDQLRQGRMALRQYLVEFGLTPASRSRVKLPPAQESVVDEFAAHQRARPRLARVK